MAAVELIAVLSLSGILLAMTIGMAYGFYLFCKYIG